MTLTWDDRESPASAYPAASAVRSRHERLRRRRRRHAAHTDRKDFHAYGNIQPFSQVKNKWISGLTIEYGAGSVTLTTARRRTVVTSTASRSRRGGRQTLFNTGANSVGDGLTSTGSRFRVARRPIYLTRDGKFPCRIADLGGQRGRKKANEFLIGHDLYLWSPKGFLTGSSTTAGSILVGYHFERTDYVVGCNGGTGIPCPAGNMTAELDNFTVTESAPRMGSVVLYRAAHERGCQHPVDRCIQPAQRA